MIQIKNPKAIKPGAHYLRRNGGWFRPEAHGYTDDIAEAGTFSSEEAASYMNAEGVTAVTMKSMREELWKEMQASLARAARLAELALSI